MKLVQFHWNPTRKQLRQFGVAAVICLPLLGWLVAGAGNPVAWHNEWATFAPFAVVGLALAVLGFVVPSVVKPVYIAASLITFPIGLIVGELLLFAIFYLVVTPIALVFRLIGRDPLNRKFDRKATTYWEPIKPVTDVRSYYRQS